MMRPLSEIIDSMAIITNYGSYFGEDITLRNQYYECIGLMQSREPSLRVGSVNSNMRNLRIISEYTNWGYNSSIEDVSQASR